MPYTAVTATVTSNPPCAEGASSTVFQSSFLLTLSDATAQAVTPHRPRDIGLVMDLSGSMRYNGIPASAHDFPADQARAPPITSDTNVPAVRPPRRPPTSLIFTGSGRTSAVDNYAIPASNHTVTNASYTRTYINNFYSNAAYASTLIRAFDSYTSTDGGNTWSAPTSGGPVLPPASYTTTPGGDPFLFFHSSTSNYAQEVEDVVNGTSRNNLWELDGYSACTNGALNAAYLTQPYYPGNSSNGANTTTLNGTGQSAAGAFNGYTQGPGYYGKTFFIWPPDPRRPLDTGTATAWNSTTANDIITIQQFLVDFGYTKSNDFSNSGLSTPTS